VLDEKLKEARYKHGPRQGQKAFTNLSAISYLLFVLIYFPCLAVFIAIMKEAGWKWAIFVAAYTTSLAWLLSFIAFQVGSLF
jgi:ferrous iron transport protein B